VLIRIFFLVVAQSLEILELCDTNLDLDLVFQALASNPDNLAIHQLQSVNFSGNKCSPTAGAIAVVRCQRSLFERAFLDSINVTCGSLGMLVTGRVMSFISFLD